MQKRADVDDEAEDNDILIYRFSIFPPNPDGLTEKAFQHGTG